MGQGFPAHTISLFIHCASPKSTSGKFSIRLPTCEGPQRHGDGCYDDDGWVLRIYRLWILGMHSDGVGREARFSQVLHVTVRLLGNGKQKTLTPYLILLASGVMTVLPLFICDVHLLHPLLLRRLQRCGICLAAIIITTAVL